MPPPDALARCRSVPYRTPYYFALFWTILHVFCVISTLMMVVLFFLNHQQANGFNFKRYIIAGAISSLVTLIISYSRRRAARCPLCIGTPLMNTGALTHKRSTTIGPLNEGYSALVSIAFTQKFRCMYCGTRYDLLKSTHKKKHRQATES